MSSTFPYVAKSRLRVKKPFALLLLAAMCQAQDGDLGDNGSNHVPEMRELVTQHDENDAVDDNLTLNDLGSRLFEVENENVDPEDDEDDLIEQFVKHNEEEDYVDKDIVDENGELLPYTRDDLEDDYAEEDVLKEIQSLLEEDVDEDIDMDEFAMFDDAGSELVDENCDEERDEEEDADEVEKEEGSEFEDNDQEEKQMEEEDDEDDPGDESDDDLDYLEREPGFANKDEDDNTTLFHGGEFHQDAEEQKGGLTLDGEPRRSLSEAVKGFLR
eukprot:TRINITY_DN69305_c0_g1_i1.p1 TRINITY_DN69305_c0_g1~~TRINITY_DN69305_c0_g1_i1.p1  ORF type:complete len:272 (-),score=90.05 TRINITY_DN69305_c0_g1_i1:35-850(-)